MSKNIFAKRFPPGHFYSPLPDAAEVQADADRIFAKPGPALRGIDLNVDRQLELFAALSTLVDDIPAYESGPIDGHRFYHGQHFYSYKDATLYSLMIRHVRPKRIIEVGCGHSSHIALDMNQLFFDDGIELSFIDPYPERFKDGLHDGDEKRLEFIESRVQDVPSEVFGRLESGDMLFIDSSHVAKVGGDVNHLLFNVLPALPAGVFIHVHDIFYPFEYLKNWVEEGRAWNETYMLRAFLQYNTSFSIELFTSYLWMFHRPLFKVHPFLDADQGSRGSIWLKKTVDA